MILLTVRHEQNLFEKSAQTHMVKFISRARAIDMIDSDLLAIVGFSLVHHVRISRTCLIVGSLSAKQLILP